MKFCAGSLMFASGPAVASGIATFVPPMLSAMPLPLLPSTWLNWNWNVRSSTPSPVLSTWISYSASGSSEKKFGPPYFGCSGT